MKMIESVARAICVCMEADSTNWRIYQDEAKAAIEAMREPSKRVEDEINGWFDTNDSEAGKRAWEAAIDAALKEGC